MCVRWCNTTGALLATAADDGSVVIYQRSGCGQRARARAATVRR